MRHAYLIMAHENSYVLETLIRMLDYPENDIYIHVDKKCRDFDFSKYSKLVSRSSLTFIDRVNVAWGSYSQIEAEVRLVTAAYVNGGYDYYHLLSGSDLPIKSQRYILDFFEKYRGSEFIGFADNVCEDRVRKIHLFTGHLKDTSAYGMLLRVVRHIFLKMQQMAGYRRGGLIGQMECKKGTNWFSVSGRFVSYLIDGGLLLGFSRALRYSLCGDEHLMQTLVYNSEFRGMLFNADDELQGCMRLIDWKRGSPYVWRAEDLEEIMSSDGLFARKFSNSDRILIDSIRDRVMRQN